MADGRDWLSLAGSGMPGGQDGIVRFPPEWRAIPRDPGATVTAGDVLDTMEADRIFVCLEDGVSGDTIYMATQGVWELPKVDGAVITAGEMVYWDDSVNKVDDDQATPATGDFKCGMAMETKGATTDETIAVLINIGDPPTVT